MNRILKKIKELGGSVLGGLLALIFTSGAKAQYSPVPEYGVSIPVPLYGVPAPGPMYGVLPTPGEMLLRPLPLLAGAFLVFVIAPVVGLIWYRKRGGKKKWPSVIVWILAALFVLVLVAFIFTISKWV